MNDATRLLCFDPCPGDPHRPTSTPIYQTATFQQSSPDAFDRYDYSRTDNPTRTVLETQLAALERGTDALTYASGMAAIAAVFRLLKPGDQIVACCDLYGGTMRLLGEVIAPTGIDVVFADATDIQEVERAITPRTRLLYIESPSNPLQLVCDIRRLATTCVNHGVRLAVDNTMMSPVLQKPLELGADIVIHSATKSLAGHADVTAGAVIVRDAALARRLAFLRNAEGNALAPFESWLLLRGLKTLPLRIRHQQHSALRIARFLEAHPQVTTVNFVGLESHPHHARHAQQADGPGAVISFEAASAELASHIVGATRLFATTVSFGSIGSSISLPSAMSHASIPAALAGNRGFGPNLVRISVGIEEVDDLIADLSQAIESATETNILTTRPTLQAT